ncbi:MAG: ester cyclase [Deltaproteobacteria bacterium]|nr:ester cyclase [Deltaproteobacteria bacterium]
MKRSLAAKIRAANSALIANGNLDAETEFFAPDYVAHLTNQDMTGGHDAIRKVLRMYRRAFPDTLVDYRSRRASLAGEETMTDCVPRERLFFAAKF